MENASKALLIAGAILLSILIIAIGIFIFNSASGQVNDALLNMSTQEKNAFNSNFTSYQGDEISGSNVKSLLTFLATNYGTHIDEPSLVPSVNYAGNSATYDSTTADENAYTDAVSGIRNSIINKHTYQVQMNFNSSGIISEIVITDVTN